MKKVLILVGIGIILAFIAVMFRNVIKYVTVRIIRGTFGVMSDIDKKYRDKYSELKAKDEENKTKQEDKKQDK